MKVKNLEATLLSKMTSTKKIEVETFRCKNTVIWNHKYFDWIHIDPDHTDSNQPIPDDLKNTGSIHDLADICAIEKILTSLVDLVNASSPETHSENIYLWDSK